MDKQAFLNQGKKARPIEIPGYEGPFYIRTQTFGESLEFEAARGAGKGVQERLLLSQIASDPNGNRLFKSADDPDLNDLPEDYYSAYSDAWVKAASDKLKSRGVDVPLVSAPSGSSLGS